MTKYKDTKINIKLIPLLIFMILMGAINCAKAENNTSLYTEDYTYFSSDLLTADLKVYNDITQKFRGNGNKTWSKELLKAFPLDNINNIHYKYVITSYDSILDKNEILKKSCIWMHKIFDVPNGEDVNVDSANFVIKAVGQWANVGQHYGMGATIIHAPIKMRIVINDNNITAEIKVEHYRLGAYNPYGSGMESNLVPINAAYPCDMKSSHKESFAMAFINCNCYSLNSISNYINFLNKKDADINDDW